MRQSRWWRLAPWLCMLALALLVVYAAVPRGPRYLYVIHKTGHPLVFGVIAWLLARELSRAPRPSSRALAAGVWALAGAVLIGGATELAQLPLQRGASWLDVGRDALGAATALALRAALLHRTGPRVAAAALLLTCTLAPLFWCVAAYAHRAAQFPVIAQFRSPLDRYFIAPGTSLLALDVAQSALHVAPGARGSVMYLDEPAADWRGYGALEVQVENPNDVTLRLMVRVHDERHTWQSADRYNGEFDLAPHARQAVRIPLAVIATAPRGRRMDLARIAGVAVFVPAGPPLPFLLHALRLLPAA